MLLNNVNLGMFNQNLNRFSFNRSKALEVLLYISARVPDMYKTLKILYFADKLHLSKYGRFINGDTYIAMVNGPVPSESYDIIRGIRGIGLYPASDFEKDSFSIKENNLIPSRVSNSSLLSKSDIECLNEAIMNYKDFTFQRLHDTSSDRAYNSADINGEMTVESIAETLPNAKAILAYLEEMYND
jgi:hypothetical protein